MPLRSYESLPRFIRDALRIPDPGGWRPELGDRIHPVVVVRDYERAGYGYGCGVLQAAQVGLFNHAQVWNSLQSGKVVYVDSSWVSGAGAQIRVVWGPDNVVKANGLDTFKSVDVDGPPTQTLYLGEAMVAPQPARLGTMQILNGDAKLIEFDPPIRLLPNRGFSVANQTANQPLEVSFSIREVPL